MRLQTTTATFKRHRETPPPKKKKQQGAGVVIWVVCFLHFFKINFDSWWNALREIGSRLQVWAREVSNERSSSHQLLSFTSLCLCWMECLAAGGCQKRGTTGLHLQKWGCSAERKPDGADPWLRGSTGRPVDPQADHQWKHWHRVSIPLHPSCHGWWVWCHCHEHQLERGSHQWQSKRDQGRGTGWGYREVGVVWRKSWMCEKRYRVHVEVAKLAQSWVRNKFFLAWNCPLPFILWNTLWKSDWILKLAFARLIKFKNESNHFCHLRNNSCHQ